LTTTPDVGTEGAMSETLQDAWFYTREGEKIGPVTLAELRVKAQEGGLNPRLDMVWCAGMTDWKAAGEIDGLFARRGDPDLNENQSSTTAPYESTEESVEEAMSHLGEWPGARRRGFFVANIIFPIVWPMLVSMSSIFFIQQFGPRIEGVMQVLAGFLPLVVAVWVSLARLTNLGMSRWWFLGNLVPFLNFWVGYRCFACPAGYAYHKKLDGVGIMLAIVYWLMVVVSLVMVAAFIALLFGIAGDPAMQEKMREILRAAQESAAKPS
jgi:uncharacterized membrane protein YhaH (DUF805 family)